MAALTLLDLTPTQFESLTYDLLLASGFNQLIWRTPGADGGRDIEALFTHLDAIGEEVRQKWYIECKRYESSVDWPTIYSKIPYAVNHLADYLLLVSSANPSPKCEDEIIRWNDTNHLKIKFWRGYQLNSLARIHPAIGIKYGLIAHASAAPISMTNLTMLALKAALSAQASTEFNRDPTLAIAAASGCSELVLQRSVEIAKYGRAVFLPRPNNDLPAWVAADKPIGGFDDIGLNAFLAYLRFCRRPDRVTATCNAEHIGLTLERPSLNFSASSIQSLNEISIWSDTEFEVLDRTNLILRKRNDRSTI